MMHISPNGKRRNLDKSAASSEWWETPVEPTEQVEVKTAGNKAEVKTAQETSIQQPGTEALPGVGEAEQEPAGHKNSFCPNPRCNKKVIAGPIGTPCECGQPSVSLLSKERSMKERGTYGTQGLEFLAKRKNLIRIAGFSKKN
jgi:hypothetical protein